MDEAAAADAALDLADSEVIVITGEDPNRDEPVTYELSGEELKRLPGSGNDSLKALQSLPAVGRTPLGLGGLSLRGSSPRDSAVYLDGIEVPLLYHFGGLASIYPSSMLSAIELQPGSFDASYGRAQGGIVTLTSKPGRSDKWRMAAEASLLDARVSADGPGAWGGTWSVGLRRSYVDAILGAVAPSDSDFDLTLAPRYYDGQLRYDLSRGDDQIAVLLFGSDDRLQFGFSDDDGLMPTTDRLQFRQSFLRLGVNWKRAIGDAELSVVPWVGYDRAALQFNDEGSVRKSIPMGLRSQLRRDFDWGHVRGGIELRGGRSSYDVANEPPPMPGSPSSTQEGDVVAASDALWYSDIAGFYDAKFDFAKGRLGIAPGLRIERSGLTGEVSLDPRLTVSHRLASWFTLKESFGIYSQAPLAVDLESQFGNTDIRGSKSIQATIGVDAELPGDVEVAATAYSDDVQNLAVDVVSGATAAAGGGQPTSGGIGSFSRELLSSQFGNYAYQENVGRARNVGVEFLVRRNTPRFAGWLSYTLSSSQRRDDPRQFPSYRPYVLDQPHRLTALGSVKLGRGWLFGARVRYATGNPFTPVAGTYFDTDAQEYQPIDGPVLSERLPAFFQLDLRIDKQWQRDSGRWALFLDVQNVTNRVNAEGVQYNFDYQEISYTRGLPVFPSIGLEWVQ